MLTFAVALGIGAALAGAALLARYCAGVLRDAQTSHRMLEANMERLALRARAAAQVDRERARRIAETAAAMQDVAPTKSNLVRLPDRRKR